MVIKGITSIQIGAIAADGGMGQVLATLCNTVAGTATLETAEGETIELPIEESDSPDHSETLAGITTLKWRIADFNPDTMVKVLGGATSGTGAAKAWSMPSQKPVIEQSLCINTTIPATGKIEFPRVSLSARIVAPLDKKQYGNIEITAKVLQPTKAATSPMKWTPGA